MTLYILCYTFTACVYGYLSSSVVFGNFLDSHERLRNIEMTTEECRRFMQVGSGIFLVFRWLG